MPKADLSGEEQYILHDIVSLMVLHKHSAMQSPIYAANLMRRQTGATMAFPRRGLLRDGYIPGKFYPTVTLFK
jgi:hypothetical protein